MDKRFEALQREMNANIIVEKPICPFSHIDALKNLLENFQGKIVVNQPLWTERP